MSKNKFVPLTTLLLLIGFCKTEAQVITNTSLLQRASLETAQKEKARFQQVLAIAKQKGWPLIITGRNGRKATLQGIDVKGIPIYFTTNDNIISAATIRTNLLWPGGSTGLNLNGSSANMKSKIAIWDGGKVRNTHIELTGRVVQKDNATVIDDHATHTSGTLIAAGVNPLAKGMSFGAQQLLAYDYNNDESEMLGASPNIVISNHSYGAIAGWNYNTSVTPNRWEFWGNAGDTVDYKFGYYDDETQMWDSIAYNAPYYLIVKSAGNNRSENGPAVGQPYWRYNSAGIMVSSGNRPAGISNNDGYDILPTYSVAKNILTVGAINPIPFGYTQPSDVVQASFSSWGPTDDGRIKPDVVTDGVNVLSSYGTADDAYAVLSGTSMSSPAAAGSLFLLQEYYSKLHSGNFMRSATLKGIIIHTADEAGPSPGPDYQNGWGLIDMQKAASVITSDTMASNPDQKIYENILANGATYTLSVVASGKGPLVATVCWTDPKATVDEVNVLNNPARKLINDLDMRITSGSTTYQPWTLDRLHPGNAATPGDDSLNNVEKIEITNPVPGQTYTIKITHKGTLQRGQQAYSLLISGIGGQSYCASAATSSAGTRIDSVSISNINNANPAGCTTYTNYTNQTVQIQPSQKIPIRIRLSSCDASSAQRVVKVFIDYNNNGVFDADELAAQSSVLAGGTTVYTDTITTPASLTPGNFTQMRIIARETTDPSTVNACGNYGNGETEDYGVAIVVPANDLALAQIISPMNGDCSDSTQLVVVAIRNQGSDTVSNVPLTAIIKNGSTTIATLNEKYPATISPNHLVTYTFQQPFLSLPSASYTITSYLTLNSDQLHDNDTAVSTATIASKPDAPSGAATVNGDSVTLQIVNPDVNSSYFWYNSSSSNSPLFATADTTINITSVPSGQTFYVGTGAQSNVGLTSKGTYTGGYQANGGNFLTYTSQVPVVLKSARLYTGNRGKVTIMVVDTVMVNGNIEYYIPALSSTTIDVYATNPNGAPGSVSGNNPSDTGAVFYINLALPAGKHVIMDTTVDASVDSSAIDNATIYRSNGVTGNPYPFTIPGIISITGNSATSSTNPTLYQSYYYYLYNMKMQTDDCISSRSAISVSVPTNVGFKVWPNPNQGLFNVFFDAGTTGNFSIELFDMLGRKCFSQNYSATGLFSTQINAHNLITGMYILSVKLGGTSYKQKILVLR